MLSPGPSAQPRPYLGVNHLERNRVRRTPPVAINMELVREKATDIRHALTRLRRYTDMERPQVWQS